MMIDDFQITPNTCPKLTNDHDSFRIFLVAQPCYLYPLSFSVFNSREQSSHSKLKSELKSVPYSNLRSLTRAHLQVELKIFLQRKARARNVLFSARNENGEAKDFKKV